jgi:hypothetical protein
MLQDSRGEDYYQFGSGSAPGKLHVKFVVSEVVFEQILFAEL